MPTNPPIIVPIYLDPLPTEQAPFFLSHTQLSKAV